MINIKIDKLYDVELKDVQIVGMSVDGISQSGNTLTLVINTTPNTKLLFKEHADE